VKLSETLGKNPNAQALKGRRKTLRMAPMAGPIFAEDRTMKWAINQAQNR